MARCTDCIHDRVCGMKFNLEQVDKFNWEELRDIKNVEKVCRHYLPIELKEKYTEETNG